MTIQPSPIDSPEEYCVSAQDVAYFNTFGFLRLPGLFRADIEEICAGFERVFADPQYEHWELRDSPLHGGDLRVILTGFIEKDDALRGLRHDPRVVGVVKSLLGDDVDYTDSDGNIWYCETSWHADVYKSPLSTRYVKLSFYLDSLDKDNGAIRLIPGTNFHSETFAETLRNDLANPETIEDVYGVEGPEIPSWTLPNEPGDLIVWDQRTIHASYNGTNRRRSFALTFKEVDQDEGKPSA